MPSERPYQSEVCNICGGTKYHLVRHFGSWTLGRDVVDDVSIIRCDNCGIRRRSPALVDDYEEGYHAPYVQQGQAIHPHQLSHFADLMTARLSKMEEGKARFLDVGCSTGRALRLAEALGFSPVGIDYSKWAVQYCVDLGFEARHGSLFDQWSESAQFDVIHCSHTIEHVPDPPCYCREMHRLLSSGGQLMIAFPNYNSIPRLLMGERWPIWCLDSHLWQFTAGQMKRLLKSHGFSIFTCRTLHGYRPKSRLKKRLLDIGSQLGFGDGCNIIATKL